MGVDEEAKGAGEPARDVPRISSGTPHLDVVLCGGWLRGGSNNLPGKHTFLINEKGVRIFPRWEAAHAQAAEAAPDPDTRLLFGIPRLDAMCGGGLVSLSTTMLLGNPGSGKTLLGLNFLAEGARRGEPGLYFGFAENGKALVRKGRSIGLDVEPLVARVLPPPR